MSHHPELLATCWTTAGTARPDIAPARSPFTLEERIAATAEGGWRGFGLVHADLAAYLREHSPTDLRALLDDHGIEHLELELIGDWWAGGERRAASDRVRRELLTAAEQLGARTIKIGPDTPSSVANRTDPTVTYAQFVESLAQLAAEAAEHGTRVALEFLPWADQLNDLEAGIALVEEVGHPAAGLCLDIWHVARAGTDYGVVTERLPLERLFSVELNDAAAEPIGTLFADTVERRLLPGEGSFHVPAFINAVRDTGFTGPWGVEMLSDRHRSLPLEQGLAEARDAALACFAAADGVR